MFAAIADPASTGLARENFAFFESYFSNYIEGTTFTVAEAESIVFEGRIIENRSADSHDILGTFAAATRPPWRDRPAQDADGFLAWLKSVNAQVMQQRPDKRPGEWKDQVNQAGSTVFVLPELVPGTLREAFERILALADPLARALMTMFVVNKVHPFIDGNGRTARLAMNVVLSAAGLARIIVPTVYREDYLLPLKALSNNADAIPFVAAMTRIQSWSAAFDHGVPRDQLSPRMAACHACARFEARSSASGSIASTSCCAMTSTSSRTAAPESSALRTQEFLDGGVRALSDLRSQGVVSAIGLGVNEWQVSGSRGAPQRCRSFSAGRPLHAA